MSFWEILLIVCCAVFVITIAVTEIIKKSKGGSCCDCPHAKNCKKCSSNCECEKNHCVTFGKKDKK